MIEASAGVNEWRLSVPLCWPLDGLMTCPVCVLVSGVVGVYDVQLEQ